MKSEIPPAPHAYGLTPTVPFDGTAAPLPATSRAMKSAICERVTVSPGQYSVGVQPAVIPECSSVSIRL